MDAFDISVLTWGRVVERLLIVGFSGLSMILGWNLFVKGVVIDQEAEGRYKGWKVTLRKVGPGVFFALFGSAIVVFALFSPLTVSLPSSNDKGAVFSYFQKDNASLRRLVRTLNTFLIIGVSKVTFEGTPVVAGEYTKAQGKLESFRYTILLSQFSRPDLDVWRQYGSKYSTNPNDVPPEFRDVLGRMKPWFDETIAMEAD